MIRLPKSKIITSGIAIGMMSMTGCTTSNGLNAGYQTQYQSHYQNQGYQNRLAFPRLETAWQKNGLFPNIENLSKIRPGLVKDELYKLIGRPHFDEFLGAREWDYILKFYRQDNSVQVCQYKVLWTPNYRVQSTHWYPSSCAAYAKPAPKKVIVQQQIAPPTIIQQPNPKLHVVHEKLTLDADALFAFNRSSLANMLPKGRIELDNMVNKLRQFSLQGDIKIYITGHTDYKGKQQYNYNLSRKRAQTVLEYLAQKGISRSIMSASGAGEDFPVKHCRTDVSRTREISCLQENRRVEIDVVINQRKQTMASPVIRPIINTAPVQPAVFDPNAVYLQNNVQNHPQADFISNPVINPNGAYIQNGYVPSVGYPNGSGVIYVNPQQGNTSYILK